MSFTRLILLLALALHAPAADVLLSPAGPISSFSAARDAARAGRAQRVIVADGEYAITERLQLTAADSGVSWEAAPGAKPVLTGGRRIQGWSKDKGPLWKASLLDAVDGRWTFQQLWINGRLATLARTPNVGYYHITEATGADVFPGVKDTLFHAFSVSPQHYSLIQSIPQEQREQLLITVTHAWAVSQCRVKAMDDATRSILIKGKSRYPFVQFEPDQRYWLENLRSGLDAPGEWFLDSKTGELFYHPLPEEDMEKATVIAPVQEHLLEIKAAHDIAFKGIHFSHCRYVYGPEGQHDGQAATSIDAALQMEDCQRIRFQDCSVSHVGRHAIQFKNGCSDSEVVHCHLHDLGGGGVYVGETRPPAEERINHHIRVHDCIIQHGGRLHPAACGVVFTHTQHCTVSHCDIGDFYYTGVSAGWNWGYGESLSRETQVLNNHIHHLGWAYLSDMGGYYGLSSSPGTVVSGNHVHHVASHRYGGWGLYNDEGSSDTLMENNLVHDTSNSGFHQHYGYANRVRNNIFAFGKTAQIQRSRNEARLCFIYEKNIVLWDPASPLLDGGEWNWKLYDKAERGDPKDSVIFRRNLYWPTDGKIPAHLTKTHMSWPEWLKMGRDAGSQFADPLFENLTARDFRVKPQSPALKMGFKPWDHSLAGVEKKDAAWLALAAAGQQYPQWEEQAKPWPAPAYEVVEQSFEHSGIGTTGLRNSRYTEDAQDKSLGASIGVVQGISSPFPTQTKQTAQRALRIQDAAGLTRPWEPVLDISTQWTGGSLSAEFDLMIEKEAQGFFEMREGNSGEFAAGPIVQWAKGKLTAGNAKRVPLAEYQPGEWLRISIQAQTLAGHYSVTITRMDGQKQEFKQLPCQPTWSQGSYLLFSSLAQQKTAYYIDNVTLRQAK